MAWVDYKKAYDIVPHLWIITTTGMVRLADNIIGLIKQSVNRWKINLYADGKLLGSVPIRRGIFQGDSISPLLIVIALLPLAHILTEIEIVYQLEKTGAKFNHLFFMDDLKLYRKNDKENISSKVNKQVFLVGNFNINLLNYSDPQPINEILDSLASNSFIQYILQPTRITSHSKTVLDNILSDINSHEVISGNMIIYLSFCLLVM